MTSTLRYVWAFTAALAVALTAEAQQPIVIKFSHVVAVDAPKGKAAEQFKKLAEERTGGRVKIEVYANSALYKDKEELEALQLGSVQMLAPSLAKFGPLSVREFEVFDLPYLFADEAQFKRVADGPIGLSLLKKLDAKGIIGLGYLDNGFHAFTSNKPLRKPEDFKGLKMRIQSSKVLDAQMRALGANPQVMSASEVYQALQTGIVDGSEGVPSGIYTQKLFEVQKHITVSNHGHLAYAFIANKAFWDGLPADIRASLEGAVKEALEFGNLTAKKDNAEALEKIKATRRTEVYALTPQEIALWKAALLPVHKQMESRIGKELIQAAHKEVGIPD